MKRGRDFYEWGFRGLDAAEIEYGVFTMNRVSRDESKIVVRVDESEIHRTRYGYSLDLDAGNVLWLRRWQVYGVEVLLDAAWFIPSPYKNQSGGTAERLEWDWWKSRAEAQKGTEVRWCTGESTEIER